VYKVLVIGAVNSTKHTFYQLNKYGFDIIGVLGHEPINKNLVSGWVNLKEHSKRLSISYKGFKRINDFENIKWAIDKKPDLIFAVGFSQLMSQEWLQIPSLGCIGFHPTLLPKGRGRAPLAWITLEKSIGSATFFLMGNGADDGPIFIQKTFEVEEDDDAKMVENKIEIAIITSLDEWLPRLKKGLWEPIPQDETAASWYGKRSIEDGIINWQNSAYYINRLIKASSIPHPGAYTYFKDTKLIIWKSEVEENIDIKGVVGRILLIDKIKGYLVQCGEGLLWINNLEFELAKNLSIGEKLGYNIEDEIYDIKKKLNLLKHE
jgi:methionyl-tRNA formyltransferase